MASSSLTSTLTPSCSKSPFCPSSIPKFTFRPAIYFSRSLWSVPAKPIINGLQKRTHSGSSSAIKAATTDFSGSFFERGLGEEAGDKEGGEDGDDEFDGEYKGKYEDDDEDDDRSLLPILDPYEEREEPECPPGFRKYETMAILNPVMSEDERLTLTQKYEELLVAGGGMYIEVFNRGVLPLAYEIKKKDEDGKTCVYMDGIYILFTFFTKPESIEILNDTLLKDYDVLRSCTSKVLKKKIWQVKLEKYQKKLKDREAAELVKQNQE